MSNVVSFKPDQRGKTVADRGADMGRILLFTGVRYFRDELDVDAPAETETALHDAESAAAAEATERLKA